MVRTIGLGLLGLLVVAFIALNALAWSGALVDEDAARPQRSPVAPPDSGVDDFVTEPPAPKQPSPLVSSEKPGSGAKRARATLILAATRGDCWVEVRAGSATGQPLYAGTLLSGKTLRFSRPRLWLRLGAASNVDIMVNGRPSAVPSGTVELTVPDA